METEYLPIIIGLGIAAIILGYFPGACFGIFKKDEFITRVFYWGVLLYIAIPTLFAVVGFLTFATLAAYNALGGPEEYRMILMGYLLIFYTALSIWIAWIRNKN